MYARDTFAHSIQLDKIYALPHKILRLNAMEVAKAHINQKLTSKNNRPPRNSPNTVQDPQIPYLEEVGTEQQSPTDFTWHT